MGNAKVPPLPPGITFFSDGRGSSGPGYYPRQGRSHSIPDALCRAPVNDLAPDDEITNDDVQSFAIRVVIRQVSRMQQANEEQEGDGL
jgi:hypothetical protein